jgi:hypothetical protein
VGINGFRSSDSDWQTVVGSAACCTAATDLEACRTVADFYFESQEVRLENDSLAG